MKAKMLLFGLILLSAFLFLGSSALARDGEDDNSGASSSSETSTPKATGTPKSTGDDRKGKFLNQFENKFTDKFSPRPTSKPERSPDGEGKERLSELKLKACEAREESVKESNESLMSMVAKMVGKFDAIAVRVQEFYTDKLLPKGKVLTNYDALVSDINSKKAEVDTALKSVPDTTTFDCSSDDPKGLLTEYRTKMQSVKTALHNYRTSIKNLIVAVHKLAGDGDKSESPKPSATPTPTPTASPST